MIPECPECKCDTVCAESKAFVRQDFSWDDDGSLTYEPYASEDVDFDGPGWFSCWTCGFESTNADDFKPSEDE